MRLSLFRIALIFAIIYSATGCMPRAGKETTAPGPDIRVLIGSITFQDTLSFTGDYRLKSEEAEYEFGPRNRSLTIRALTDGVQLYNQNRNLLYRNHFPIILDPVNTESRFTFRGLLYSGAIVLQPAEEGGILLVNRLNIEAYLKGVVPAEIFSINTEDLQAVKAQAICARTYALRRLQENSGGPFDITAGTADQVYGSFDRHTILADQAVEETRGIVLTDHNYLATVYYHSTCGGKTEAAENIFNTDTTGYLISMTDAIGDRFACAASPYFRWAETRTIEQLDSAFQSRYGKSYLNKLITDTTTVRLTAQITKRSSGGRVQSLTLGIGDTTVTLNGYEIRRFFATPPNPYLRSTLFYLDQYNDSTLVIHGAGFGHGVGLCQYGALEMARSGFQYYHILNKYFPATELTKKY